MDLGGHDELLHGGGLDDVVLLPRVDQDLAGLADLGADLARRGVVPGPLGPVPC